MFPYTRLYQIFNSLKTNLYTSKEELVELLNVSDRTIRYDIQTLNDILKTNGAIIILKRKMGYSLVISNEEKYLLFLKDLSTSNNDNHMLESSEDRLNYLLSYLLYADDYIKLQTLMDVLFISKNTLSSYLKTISKTLEDYQLELIRQPNIGVKIIGSEENKRACLLENTLNYNYQDYIIGFSKQEYSLFKGIDLELIQKIVISRLDEDDIETDDFKRKNLIIHIALLISRIQANHFIDKIEIPKMSFQHSQCLDNIIYDIETAFFITIPNYERNYLGLHFIVNTDYEWNSNEIIKIKAIVDNVLESIYHNYNFDLKNDDILFTDLTNHFYSILQSKSLRINKRNPLLNTIKSNFPLPFEIALTAISEVFKNSPYTLTENEIGYVSLHIGAAIERCFSGMIERKTVLLICGSGQATSRMLEVRINTYFKDKIQIIKKVSYGAFSNMTKSDLQNIDFAISTIPIETSLLPVVIVDFALNKKDIETITRFLATISSTKAKKLTNFFDESIFINKNNFSTKKELLLHLSNLLENKGYVNGNFYESVMEREKIACTNMNSIFALPHPMELCANETKVAVAILDKPIKWDENSNIQIVLLLAIKHGDHLNIEHLYDVFIQIMNSIKLQNDLLHCHLFSEFMNIISSNL